MRSSLKMLLSEVFDYAGLFPPAQLGMGDALSNYIRYLAGPESWVVGRFVCSTSRLDELGGLIAAHTTTAVIPVTAVGKASQDSATWEAALEHDAAAMNRFNNAYEGKAEIQGFEIRVPNHEQLDRFAKDLRGFDEADVYVELPWSDGMEDSLALISDTGWLRAKARTGGLTADAFPAAADLANFLHTCISSEIQFKLTAGLHHPFPEVREGLPMHGFLNVLVASALIYAEDLPRTAVTSLLSETDRKSIVLADTEVRWREHAAGLKPIEDMRDLFVGIGSCSIEEPLDDLTSEGLIS